MRDVLDAFGLMFEVKFRSAYSRGRHSHPLRFGIAGADGGAGLCGGAIQCKRTPRACFWILCGNEIIQRLLQLCNARAKIRRYSVEVALLQRVEFRLQLLHPRLCLGEGGGPTVSVSHCGVTIRLCLGESLVGFSGFSIMLLCPRLAFDYGTM